jgi:hypothetical protein
MLGLLPESVLYFFDFLFYPSIPSVLRVDEDDYGQAYYDG